MIGFSAEKVLLLHKLMLEETGGDPNLRDFGLLDSALASAFQSFGGRSCIPQRRKRRRGLAFRSSQIMPLWTETSG